MDGNIKIVVKNHKAVSWNKIYSAGHWRTRQQLAKEIHELVGFTAKSQIKTDDLPLKFPVDIKITAYYKTKHRRDSDNINSKVYLDSLKQIVYPDDDTRYIRAVTTEARIGQKEDKVEILIKERNDK